MNHLGSSLHWKELSSCPQLKSRVLDAEETLRTLFLQLLVSPGG